MTEKKYVLFIILLIVALSALLIWIFSIIKTVSSSPHSAHLDPFDRFIVNLYLGEVFVTENDEAYRFTLSPDGLILSQKTAGKDWEARVFQEQDQQGAHPSFAFIPAGASIDVWGKKDIPKWDVLSGYSFPDCTGVVSGVSYAMNEGSSESYMNSKRFIRVTCRENNIVEVFTQITPAECLSVKDRPLFTEYAHEPEVMGKCYVPGGDIIKEWTYEDVTTVFYYP